MFSLGHSKTYAQDLPLFKRLGLQPFETNNNNEIHLGQVRVYDTALIDIWVSCYPAQAYRFKIQTIEGNKFEIETGTGCLNDFWAAVLLIANDMFVVTPLKPIK